MYCRDLLCGAFYLLQITSLNHWRVGVIISEDLSIQNSNRKKRSDESKHLPHIQKAVNDQMFSPKLFLIDVFQKAATRASRPSLKVAKRWHYMQILFIILQAAQILPWLGWCSPQQLPSKVYAQGFLISSLRAAVSAALFTTAVGKLNTNLEGSICCPGGLRDRLILCVSHYETLCSLLRDVFFYRSVDGEGKVADPMNVVFIISYVSLGCLHLKYIFLNMEALMQKKSIQRHSGKL